MPLEPAHLDNLQSPTPPIMDELADAFAQLGAHYQTVLRLRY